MSFIKNYIKKKKQNYIIYKQNKKLNLYTKFIRSQVMFCGTGLKSFGTVEIQFPENISIGNNCKINSNVLLNGRSGITIGDNVTLSHGVKLISTGYDIEHWMKTGERVHIYDKPIEIGNNCWIGADAIILPGVKITGEFVVIGAGAVVTKDITESRVLVAGNPAKTVKRYDKEFQE
ncbi:MAG: acyltransferase [Clostridia bacterium]|nr:acyltransferase [Clostridia bacterium]